MDDLDIHNDLGVKRVDSDLSSNSIIEDTNSDDLIVKEHCPLTKKQQLYDYRIPSPPAVVRSEYIVQEYKGVPKPEKNLCLIEKRISFIEKKKNPKEKKTLSVNRNIGDSVIQKGLLIGGGIFGALVGVYVLSKTKSIE